MMFLSEIRLVCRCLRGVDRHYRPRMPASGAEKALTVSHISAQLFCHPEGEGGASAGWPAAPRTLPPTRARRHQLGSVQLEEAEAIESADVVNAQSSLVELSLLVNEENQNSWAAKAGRMRDWGDAVRPAACHVQGAIVRFVPTA